MRRNSGGGRNGEGIVRGRRTEKESFEEDLLEKELFEEDVIEKGKIEEEQ